MYGRVLPKLHVHSDRYREIHVHNQLFKLPKCFVALANLYSLERLCPLPWPYFMVKENIRYFAINNYSSHILNVLMHYTIICRIFIEVHVNHSISRDHWNQARYVFVFLPEMARLFKKRRWNRDHMVFAATTTCALNQASKSVYSLHNTSVLSLPQSIDLAPNLLHPYFDTSVYGTRSFDSG